MQKRNYRFLIPVVRIRIHPDQKLLTRIRIQQRLLNDLTGRCPCTFQSKIRNSSENFTTFLKINFKKYCCIRNKIRQQSISKTIRKVGSGSESGSMMTHQVGSRSVMTRQVGSATLLIPYKIKAHLTNRGPVRRRRPKQSCPRRATLSSHPVLLWPRI